LEDDGEVGGFDKKDFVIIPVEPDQRESSVFAALTTPKTRKATETIRTKRE